MANDIRQWLQMLKLEEYADAFEHHALSLELLTDLNDGDLKALGVTAIGHRKMLLRAIHALSNSTVPTAGNLLQTVTPSSGKSSVQQNITQPIDSSHAERRQLTVMFCDLVGSTALSQLLDPEDLRHVMHGYLDAVVVAVNRYQGFVAQIQGDGVLAYFGWPQAYEDQAERAIRAGLEAITAVQVVCYDKKGHTLQARVGIATGQVVVGDLFGNAVANSHAVTGETPNLAARLQAIAKPGQIIISAQTRLLIGTAFELIDLGQCELKGFSSTIPIWCIKGEAVVENRFETFHTNALTHLVGREAELDLLRACWETAKQGEEQFMLLSGEAGIGKSRIVRALCSEIHGTRHFHLDFQCSPYHTNSAYYPILDQLRRWAGFTAGDSNETKLDKLETLLAPIVDDLQPIVPLFAALLSIPGSMRYGPLELTPQQIRDQSLAALIKLFLELGRRCPILLTIEDAHWIDPSSESLLTEIIAKTHDAPVFILVIHRPEYDPPWAEHSHQTSIQLGHLRRREGAEIANNIAGSELPPAMVEQIITRADGVPLFVEELTKTILEAHNLRGAHDNNEDADALPDHAIPSTLRDSLAARLDRLGEGKQLAQIAACIGRRFDLKLLLAVSALGPQQLDKALTILTNAEFIYRHGSKTDVSFSFKHALLQDAALQSLLRTSRYQIHLQIASTLKKQSEGGIEIRPELLAHHYTEAQQTFRALQYWCSAAERAIARSENIEAINYAGTGIAALHIVNEQHDCKQLELRLQTVNGAALRATKGYAAPEVKHAYSRARELSFSLGDVTRKFPVLWSLVLHHVVRADLTGAQEIANELFILAEQSRDPEHLIEAQIAVGIVQFQLGNVTDALQHFDACTKLYDPRTQHHHVFTYGQNPGVFSLSYSAWALWFLGYPDQALVRIEQAISAARHSAHPYSIVFALTFAARIRHCRGELYELKLLTDEIISTATQHGFAYYLSQGTLERGWIALQEGNTDNGIAKMRAALEGLKATGTELGLPGFMVQLADAYINAGRNQDAQTIITKAGNLVNGRGTRFWDAEISRLKGEVLMVLSHEKSREAERYFRASLDIARAQDGRSFQLRAANSIYPLLMRSGRLTEARDILGQALEHFTEGHTCSDHETAQANIAQLP